MAQNILTVLPSSPNLKESAIETTSAITILWKRMQTTISEENMIFFSSHVDKYSSRTEFKALFAEAPEYSNYENIWVL